MSGDDSSSNNSRGLVSVGPVTNRFLVQDFERVGNFVHWQKPKLLKGKKEKRLGVGVCQRYINWIGVLCVCVHLRPELNESKK